MTTHALPSALGGPARERRDVPSPAAPYGRQGVLSRRADQGKQDPSPPATPRRRGFPGPASDLPGPPDAVHR
ncbi:hypothetical protein PYK79_53425, partial [Streptomyces sp. ID05-04B]|uniref:hypothetical protein n=1 Tax=Streptomyces sp. ID05-04B TaxID=3028661 RepID=UPI0029C2E7F7